VLQGCGTFNDYVDGILSDPEFKVFIKEVIKEIIISQVTVASLDNEDIEHIVSDIITSPDFHDQLKIAVEYYVRNKRDLARNILVKDPDLVSFTVSHIKAGRIR
jgi:vacuolar-type H+-ATPase subunit E/Vma4